MPLIQIHPEDTKQPWMTSPFNYPLLEWAASRFTPHPVRVVVEVGVHRGYCMPVWKASGASKYIGIDNWSFTKDDGKWAEKNLAAVWGSEGLLLRPDETAQLDALVEKHKGAGVLVYVDADHREECCSRDLAFALRWEPCCIVVDDYELGDVQRAVDRFRTLIGPHSFSILPSYRTTAVLTACEGSLRRTSPSSATPP